MKTDLEAELAYRSQRFAMDAEQKRDESGKFGSGGGTTSGHEFAIKPVQKPSYTSKETEAAASREHASRADKHTEKAGKFPEGSAGHKAHTKAAAIHKVAAELVAKGEYTNAGTLALRHSTLADKHA